MRALPVDDEVVLAICERKRKDDFVESIKVGHPPAFSTAKIVGIG